ncbi:thiamine monophosphate synthase [Tribonema minus]|uniref:Thiamine monophosphate synthase n=1 Tax=Tribonema minus TaxID=303371 RepID=A0A835ZKL9_9STRA|nr:thiamine monophosphate synthase [Tribonema minus]
MSAPPAIAWTIAGSDSGGGAGIQADLLAMHNLGAHGCSVITAMTAQNSKGVTKVEYASCEMIKASLEALACDLPAGAIKLGMLGTEEVMAEVASFLGTYEGPVVCDPVMISTSGSSLMDPAAKAKLTAAIFPRSTIITPNKLEAEALLGRELRSARDVERAARDLLSTGVRSVLIKGGHHDESGALAQDFWTDGERALWLSSPRARHADTHGTGCTLSAAIAACLAQGYDACDAVTIGKAYVTAGIGAARRLGAGPGPVAHTGWPAQHAAMPWLTETAEQGHDRPELPPCHRDWGLYPVVDSAEWVGRLVGMGVRDVQLRVKGMSGGALEGEIARAQELSAAAGARLWVNDFWREAVACGAYGVHMGQEDLQEQGPFEVGFALAAAGTRLGISTHSYAELARALAVRPSYISLGPVFATASKDVQFAPRGAEEVRRWRNLIPPHVPLIAIGGITLERAPGVLAAGAEGIAVIAAVTKAPDVASAVAEWAALWAKQ